MKNEKDESYFAQRGTSRHQMTVGRGVALPHAKEGVHQEAPVEKFAELLGLGKKTMIVKILANARNASQEEIEEMNGKNPKRLTTRDCGADVRD